MTQRCDGCRFGKLMEDQPDQFNLTAMMDTTVDEVWCRRFPKLVVKDPDGWCGEWQAKTESEAA
jgi:hypothetical protein